MKSESDLSKIAIKSLLYELNLQPRPWLLEPSDASSNSEQAIHQAIDKVYTLKPYFIKFVQLGEYFDGDRLSELFESLRTLGKQAENVYLPETNGVNPNQGALFSLGILLTAAGYDQEHLQETVKKMLVDLDNEQPEELEEKTDLMPGEKLYLKYGIGGVRSEAIKGFPTAFDIALPFLKSRHNDNFERNLLDTLMDIVAETDPKVMIMPDKVEELKNMQGYAKEILRVGGCNRTEGRQLLQEMNSYSNENKLGLGFYKDILIVTIFLYSLEIESNY
ncbi:triphosphoribosyl-dephospho-CoA synthase [Companilactobacillus sp. FL22-1]|uniref:triphosphoribosyl-dephospho-CoA synthase n=1 Tax=Companilactobacillus sp. FL22-1 TaxID=3373892 RepID=UPI0037553362